ncbi:TPA: HNH endonuclease [Yersinia enterocolitica]
MKEMIVPPAVIPYSQRHKNVVNSKSSTVRGLVNTTKINLQNLENQIITRYNLFEQAIIQKELFSFSEDPNLIIHKDDLLSCYTGRTSKVKEIFKLIEKSQPQRFLKRCPYCGITLPKTYDHYLPETKFPELSVHVLNLVPCCGTCNQTKNNYWKNNTHRIFLHFYSDIIPNLQYLTVKLNSNVAVNSVGAEFLIKRPENIQDKVWNILASHYEKLDLIIKYNELASDEISEVFNTCVSHLQCGGTDLHRFMHKLLAPEEKLYGINHWRVVLMKALSINNDFSRAVYADV